MATYALLNIVFVAVCLGVLRVKWRRPSRAWVTTASIVLALTALFDSVIIAYDVVGYNHDKLLGLYIGKAPIEDFFYAVLALILIPAMWQKCTKTHKEQS